MPQVSVEKRASEPNRVQDSTNEAGLAWNTTTGTLQVNDSGTVYEVGSGYVKTESIVAARTLVAADSGKVFFLNLALGFAVTLPSPAAGLRFKFIVGIAPTGGSSYTVVTAGAPAQILAGAVHSSTGGNADSETTATATTISFVVDAAVIGDMAIVESDGTSWFGWAFSNADAGITFTG